MVFVGRSGFTHAILKHFVGDLHGQLMLLMVLRALLPKPSILTARLLLKGHVLEQLSRRDRTKEL